MRPEKPRPISIWQPREVGGEVVWVRPEPSPLGDHHAARRVLHPRSSGAGRGDDRRICLFGESVAAGYLYAPRLTAASALERWLARIETGGRRHEVIDLARTNETLAGLVATAEASLQLEPDLLVLFTGNNWNLLETTEVSPYVPSAADRRRFAAALDQAGLPGVVGLARRSLDERVRAALGRLASLAEEAGVPVVVVMPEVNLADWESRQPPPWLPGDGIARWYAELEAARAALDRDDTDGAEAAAWRMNRLDGSTSPVSFRLLAEAWRRRPGREADARDAALAEVDSVHYPLLAFLAAPQATTAARALLGNAAQEHGWGSVDLREVFARHTGSPLPGRRLFLDYCHLTSEGMAVAMAATAAAVLRRLSAGDGGGVSLDWPDLFLDLDPSDRKERERLLGLSPEAEATARLGAAVHRAHRHLPVGDRRPILVSWCRSALAASPGVAAAMAELAEVRAMPRPAVLAEAARRNLASPYPLRLQHGLRWRGLDGEVLEAAREALRERHGDPLARSAIVTIERVLSGEPLPAAGLDLAAGWRHLAEPLARFYPEAMDLADLTGRAMLRCPWPETPFWLPLADADAAAGLSLRLAARLPPIPGVGAARRGPAAVTVDGREAGRVLMGERWARATFRVPAGELGPGLHRVVVRWPMPPPVGDAALEAARERLARGVEADLHPVFGEVFSFVALPAGAGAAGGGSQGTAGVVSSSPAGASPRAGGGDRRGPQTPRSRTSRPAAAGSSGREK